MKKNNENGFLLAEAIVVGVFVLSLFTFLFVNVIPLVGQYESLEKYDTIDGVYNTNIIRTMLMEDDNMAKVLPTGGTYYTAFTPETLCDTLDRRNYCMKLLDSEYLNVKFVYLTSYRTNSFKAQIETLKDEIMRGDNDYFDRASYDYIQSLDGFSQPSGTTYANYHRVIVYYNNGEFANLEIKA